MDNFQDIQPIYAASLVITGLVFTFLGYRLLRVLLAVVGFMAGALVASAVAFNYTEGNHIIASIAGFAGGISGAVLMIVLFRTGVFLLGALLGIISLTVASTALRLEPALIAILLAAVSGGIVAVLLQKIMIILATSYLGAWAVVCGLIYMFVRNFDPLALSSVSSLSDTAIFRALLVWAVLGTFGAGLQYFTAPKTVFITDESYYDESRMNVV